MSGSDSNWGRIIMAVGKSGAKIDQKSNVEVWQIYYFAKRKKINLTNIN